jgi:hypothetical protein
MELGSEHFYTGLEKLSERKSKGEKKEQTVGTPHLCYTNIQEKEDLSIREQTLGLSCDPAPCNRGTFNNSLPQFPLLLNGNDNVETLKRLGV